jgi:hypothetical protein
MGPARRHPGSLDKAAGHSRFRNHDGARGGRKRDCTDDRVASLLLATSEIIERSRLPENPSGVPLAAQGTSLGAGSEMPQPR